LASERDSSASGVETPWNAGMLATAAIVTHLPPRPDTDLEHKSQRLKDAIDALCGMWNPRLQ